MPLSIGHLSGGAVIRVERPDQIDDLERLRAQLRQAGGALIAVHVEVALKQACLALFREQLDQTVEHFNGKHFDARTKSALN